MSNPQPWFVEERAEHLAMMHLTRRDDLRVTRHRDHPGMDLLVTVVKDGVFSGRQFGVVLRARMGGQKAPRIDSRSIGLEHERFRDVPFPVCMFFFSLDTDQGYYRWILEPAVDEGAPLLEMPGQMLLCALDPASLETIVARVNAWYDARARCA
jgi:hypothetical protein